MFPPAKPGFRQTPQLTRGQLERAVKELAGQCDTLQTQLRKTTAMLIAIAEHPDDFKYETVPSISTAALNHVQPGTQLHLREVGDRWEIHTTSPGSVQVPDAELQKLVTDTSH